MSVSSPYHLHTIALILKGTLPKKSSKQGTENRLQGKQGNPQPSLLSKYIGIYDQREKGKDEIQEEKALATVSQ